MEDGSNITPMHYNEDQALYGMICDRILDPQNLTTIQIERLYIARVKLIKEIYNVN